MFVSLIGFLVKTVISILLLRAVLTRQEMYFNPIGRTVARMTDPMFRSSGFAKEQTDRLIPLAIVALGLLYAAVILLLGESFFGSIATAFDDIFRYLLLFYVVSILLGGMANKPGMGYYSALFNRLGLFWVRAARSVVRISGNGIILPAILLVFVVYLVADTLIWFGFDLIVGAPTAIGAIALESTKLGLFQITDLLQYLVWLIVARTLMSWVSPDPSNPIVQLIYALTEPVMAPFRRIIPPLGFIDLSPIILIFLLHYGRIFLQNVIVLLLNA